METRKLLPGLIYRNADIDMFLKLIHEKMKFKLAD